MVSDVLSHLRVERGDAVLDLTVGTGGHSLALTEAVGPDGLLVGIDADEDALRVARTRLEEKAPCPFKLFAARFSSARRVAREAGVETFNAALADLGVGTHQLMDASRGFSFDSEARLDMRYDPTTGPSAWDVVNRESEDELADIFYEYGEERYSRQIAARICEERPIETAAELADLIKNVVARRTPRRRTWRIHPATRVMMALRIYVNREFEELEAMLDALPDLLARDARAGIITYHSLEARRVKHTWRRQARVGLMEEMPDSPWMPSEDEVEKNPRVRSAQLRVARRL
jgi:16S rRNA (cytosine1402-N4)-methyltransferase